MSLLGNRAGSQPLHDNSDPHTYFAIFSRPSRLPLSSLALHGRATNLPTLLPKTTAFAYVTGVRRRRRASRKQTPPRAPRRRAVFRPVPNQLDKHACGLRFLPTLLLERERERDDDLDPRLNGQGAGDFPLLETLNPSYGYVGSRQVNK